VDGLEKDLTHKTKVIRLDVLSEVGQQVASRYGIRGIPTLIVVDGKAKEVHRQVGFIRSGAVVEQVEQLFNQ